MYHNAIITYFENPNKVYVEHLVAGCHYSLSSPLFIR